MSRRAVEFSDISPASVPIANAVGKPERPIFPMLHTAYDYDERF
jgi:hypothetical protein